MPPDIDWELWLGPAPPASAAVPMTTYKASGGIQGGFLHCVRTRQRPFRDVEYGHRAATVCHLGNNAHWLNRSLRCDPDKEQILRDPEAARWLDRPKRAPWRL